MERGCIGLGLLGMGPLLESVSHVSKGWVGGLQERRTNVAIGTSCETRVYACTERGSTFLAISATPIGDIKWHNYSVPLFEEGDTSAGLDHNTHILMPYAPSALTTTTTEDAMIVPKHRPPWAAVRP